MARGKEGRHLGWPKSSFGFLVHLTENPNELFGQPKPFFLIKYGQLLDTKAVHTHGLKN